MHIGDQMKEVDYECQECGETDHGRFFPGEPIFPAIQCWSCKSGHGLDLPSLLRRPNVGMWPVPEKG